ncbi:uncharacterized protein LOC142165528 [Nicotiana tabacum]|uniref:Uncharacterized protein LOC142165528 n=1 Tax=Nicotiana tabacum TaxID=4097 RepID=A0AC58S593_TOBAC
MAVLENRVKATNVDPIMKKVFSNWQWVANYDEAAGVYEMHTIQDMMILWEDLKGTMNGINGPSLIMWDFNTIMSIEDRVQGNPVQEIENSEEKFKWTNNHVHSRIDRILVNGEWIQKWLAMEGIIMNPGFLDHCPLKITIDDTKQEGRRPFKFFNYLASHQNFDEIVKQCWRKSIGHKIQVARSKLKGIQAQMTLPRNENEAILQEKVAKFELAKWLEVEESVLKQKSRIKWLKLGDSNTTYFNAYVKYRQTSNHIGRLTNSAGQILQSAIEVEKDILSFYKS